MCLCSYMGMCMCMFPLTCKEYISSPGAGVKGGCELFPVGTGNQTQDSLHGQQAA